MGKPHIRPLHPLIAPTYTEDEVCFYQWLAGFIDGDGTFKVTNTYCRLQIEQATWNLHLLQLLERKFGGTIRKCKRYPNTHIYGLSDRSSLIEIAHGINGNIRATNRIVQFQNLCNVFHINCQSPSSMNLNNAYLCGFLDADGCVRCNIKLHNVRISATSKYYDDIKIFETMFKGNILKGKSSGVFVWEISAKSDVLFAHKYFEANVKSNKLIRMKLIPLFYELKDKRAYNADSPDHSAWNEMLENWYDNGADLYRKDCAGRPHSSKARMERNTEDKNE
jgi:hypothetical protein